VFHIGGYWRGPNDIVRHMMLGLRGAGAEVYELNTDANRAALDTGGRPYRRGGDAPVWLRWEVVGPQLDAFQPELVICNAGGLSFTPAVARTLRRRLCLLGIALSDPDVHRSSTRRIARNFDFFATNSRECVASYRDLGVPSVLLPLGTNPRFFKPVAPRRADACEVLVMGTAYADRVEPVKALVREFDTHVFGSGWDAHGVSSRGLASGRDTLTALASASITVVFAYTKAGHPVLKPQLFDFMAAGALVATNRLPEVERHFEFGREVFGFTTTRGLMRVVRRALARPDESDRVRRRGLERVLAEYTWEQAWPQLLAAVAGQAGSPIRAGGRRGGGSGRPA
jgi:spore maturation protein CgeB